MLAQLDSGNQKVSLALSMRANKLALPLTIVSPSSLLKYAWNFCSKCYKLAVTMFHDDSEENRFWVTTRGTDDQIVELERA